MKKSINVSKCLVGVFVLFFLSVDTPHIDYLLNL